MCTHKRLAGAALIVGLTATASYAQSVVSAHSGTLHYFDGAVTIDGNRIESNPKDASVEGGGVSRPDDRGVCRCKPRVAGRVARREQPRRPAAGVDNPDRVVLYAVRHRKRDEASVMRPGRMIVPAGGLAEVRQLAAVAAVTLHGPKDLLAGESSFVRRVDEALAVR